MDWSDSNEYIDDDGSACAAADLTFSFLYDGFGMTMDSCEVGVYLPYYLY